MRRITSIWLVLFVVVSLISCSSSDDSVDVPQASSDAPTNGIVRVDEVPDGVDPADWNTITDRISRDLQTISPTGPVAELGLQKAWKATNRAQRLDARFGNGKLFARPTGLEAWSLELSTQAWGRDELDALGNAEVSVDGDRLEYQRDGITEWYVNGARGIEHGFDVASRPAGDGLLRIEVTVGGELTPQLRSDEMVVFVDDDGTQVLRYTGLLVKDAHGNAIPAHFEVDGTSIGIAIDDATAVYPIVVDPWVQQPKLTASDGVADSEFGRSVAVSGKTVVVGASRDDDNGANSGSAYIFENSGSGWVETKLTASDGGADDRFGRAVAISGSTIVVGAFLDDDNGNDSGSVYVFEDDGSQWVETKLMASGFDQSFGRAVAISGSTIVVGAQGNDNGFLSGSAYIYEDSGSGWVETKLVASDGEAGDSFGISVAVSGSTVVVGAYDDNDNGSGSGSAYVFENSGSGWVETKLTASDGATQDEFGTSVSVSAGTVVVGAPGDDDNITESGSAYVFKDSGTGWVETKLTASDGGVADKFGSTVAVSGDTVVVGAYHDDDNDTNSGSAYLFENRGTGWVETKLTASDGDEDDKFGTSVAMSGDSVVVGARSDVVNGIESGSAYVFLLNMPPEATDYLRTNSTQVAATEDVATAIVLEGTDREGEVTFEILTDPANGTLSITSADGTQTGNFDNNDTTTLDVTYTATSETATTDRFTYRVDDGNGGTATGTVEIDITLVNEAPSITSTAPTTATEDVAYTYALTATDPEASALTWAVPTSDSCGGTIDANATYTFTPTGPTPSTDCIVSVEVCDDGNLCDTQSATVVISAVVDTNNGTGNNATGNNATGNNATGNNTTGSKGGSGDDGCGCSSANAPANGFLALLVLALVRLRRRRRAG